MKTVGDDDSIFRPLDRADVTQFYNRVLALGEWNQVARQLSISQGSSLSEIARAFALIDMAIS